jgi:hypothetical protein
MPKPSRKDHGEPACGQGGLDLRRVPVGRVSHSVVPESNKAKTTTVISGRKWSAVSPFSGPLGSLVKMCMASSIWGSSKCALTWKPLVIKSRCLGFQLVPSMRRTSGKESGFLPTPQAFDATDIQGSPEALERAKQKGGSNNLREIVHLWPTPSSHNGTGGATGLAGGQGNRLKLYKMLGEEEGKKMACQSLNPYWVEWLMGYPLGWTDLKDSGTRLSRKLRKR